MSPFDVADYLKALREGGAMSAELKLKTGDELRVVFAPPMPGDPLDTPKAPGEWKGWAGEGDQ